MDIKSFLKEVGMQTETDVKRWGTVNIDFINSEDNSYDEVQFDVEINGNIFRCKELEELFREFCKENNYSPNMVENVVLIRSADTYEQLMALEAEEEGYCFCD